MTKQFAVIGDPVGHSLSPAIHHTLYQIYGVDASYRKIKIPAGKLPTLLPALIKEETLAGFNVTMPHKQAIIPLLSGISKEGALACSVNTVCCEKDGLHGTTTDALGFCRAVASTGRKTKGMPIVFLGAGAVCGALALHWVKEQKGSVTIIARNTKKAESLTKTLCQQGAKNITLLEWTKENLADTASKASLLVNTTPLGMTGCKEDFADLSFLSYLPKDALVYDLIYQPRQTSFLQQAQAYGHETANGIDMLIYQAMEAFTCFLGITTKDQDKDMVLVSLKQQGLL